MCNGPDVTSNCPCPVPPHPDVIAHRDKTKLQGADRKVSGRLDHGSPTGTLRGLNDGTIFPESYYQRIPVPSMARMSRAAAERAPLTGSIRVAIVLVDFLDKPMQATKKHFEDLFFSKNNIPTGSVTEYYEEVSGGKIALTGEVVGPFRMPLTLKKYAHGASGFSDAQPNLQTLAGHALAAADGKIDFTPYDNDRNGQVDAFIVVHAGTGAETIQNKVEADNNIWSAKWNLVQNTRADNVNVFAFLTIPEDARVGVCAHEIGHLVFGWPDLYDTDSPGDTGSGSIMSAGVGDWCLMGAGSWGRLPGGEPGDTPCHPSAWCKANQGWVNVISDQQNGSISLKDVKQEPREIHRLWTNGNLTSQEFFMIENRQKMGFDRSLPGFGLLIWHIDDAVEDNANEQHYKVALMQSDNLKQLEADQTVPQNWNQGDAGDPYPGTTGNSSFGAFTNPNSRTYRGRDSLVSIRNISASSQTMTMDIKVKSSPAAAPRPKL